MSRITLATVLIVGFAPSVRASANADILTACAAFAPDGSSAAVIVNTTKLYVDVTDPNGNASHLSLPLRYPPENEPPRARFYSCKTYFDQGSDLIAIGVSDEFPMRRLQIGVADAKHVEWTGDWTVEQTSGIYQPFLAGFLEGTTSVV